MLTNQLFDQHIGVRSGRKDTNEISRLLAAAVVSRQFCALLLNDPARAISSGYAGEHFSLSTEEYQFVLAAKATTLPEFAQHLCKLLPTSTQGSKSSLLNENYQVRL
jgi:hypothetical protein